MTKVFFGVAACEPPLASKAAAARLSRILLIVFISTSRLIMSLLLYYCAGAAQADSRKIVPHCAPAMTSRINVSVETGFDSEFGYLAGPDPMLHAATNNPVTLALFRERAKDRI
jgi:hypothetical protein